MKALITGIKICKGCNKEFSRTHEEARDWKEKKFCNQSCYLNWHKGENHSQYKKGFRIRPDGYLRDSKDNYIHRLVMEKKLGRKLIPEENVHHLDGNPSNNHPDNLVIFTNSQHRKLEVIDQKRDEFGRFIK